MSSVVKMNADYADLKLFLAGEWVSGGDRKTQAVINPATEDVIGHLPHATQADLDRALERAEAGFAEWRAVNPDERNYILKKAAQLLYERKEAIARTATLESGKPIAQTRVEVGMAAHIFEWYGEEGRRAYGRVLQQGDPGTRMYVVKEPVGPVAAFAPWNFPLGNPARKLGAALGAGCSCILKPAEETPASALEVARCLQDAGVPDGVFSVVFGVPVEVSSCLLASPIIRKMSFTGSIPVGKQLMKLSADNMIRTTMELGGHAPVLVFDDVDMNDVIEQSIRAKFRGAGQVCVSPTRFFVHETLYDQFVDGFTEAAGKVTVGDGLDENNAMGPLIHKRRLEDVEAIINDAVEHGARITTGGKRLDGPGYFYAPTVLADVPLDARIMNDEPFGPVAIINRFSDYDSVIVEANRLPYGLAAFAFTNSARRAKLVGRQLEAGMVGVNTFAISVPASPFGGIKQSGHGSEEGIEGLDDHMITKFISEA